MYQQRVERYHGCVQTRTLLLHEFRISCLDPLVKVGWVVDSVANFKLQVESGRVSLGLEKSDRDGALRISMANEAHTPRECE